MKKKLFCVMFFMFVLGIANNVNSEEISLKSVKQKTIEAVEFLSKHGKEGLKEFNDPNSKWTKEPYAFVDSMKGAIIGHPNKNFLGKNLLAMKDIKGKMFAAEFLKVAKSDKGSGWVDYWWPKLKGGKPVQKVTYIMRVPGQDMFVGIGIYGYSKAQAIAEAGE